MEPLETLDDPWGNLWGSQGNFSGTLEELERNLKVYGQLNIPSKCDSVTCDCDSMDINGIEVRVLCRPVQFFQTKLGNPSHYGTGFVSC